MCPAISGVGQVFVAAGNISVSTQSGSYVATRQNTVKLGQFVLNTALGGSSFNVANIDPAIQAVLIQWPANDRFTSMSAQGQQTGVEIGQIGDALSDDTYDQFICVWPAGYDTGIQFNWVAANQGNVTVNVIGFYSPTSVSLTDLDIRGRLAVVESSKATVDTASAALVANTSTHLLTFSNSQNIKRIIISYSNAAACNIFLKFGTNVAAAGNPIAYLGLPVTPQPIVIEYGNLPQANTDLWVQASQAGNVFVTVIYNNLN